MIPHNCLELSNIIYILREFTNCIINIHGIPRAVANVPQLVNVTQAFHHGIIFNSKIDQAGDFVDADLLQLLDHSAATVDSAHEGGGMKVTFEGDVEKLFEALLGNL